MSRLQKKPAAHKRGHPTLQNMNFLSFCGSFLPSWIRIRIPNTDPDPLARLNTDPIRIRIRNQIRIRNSVGKTDFFDTPFDPIKEKKFSSPPSRVSVNFFFDIRSPKKDETTQYFGKRFFYKQVLEFHRPSKFLCQTTGRQELLIPTINLHNYMIEPTCSLLELVIDRVQVDPGGVLPVHHLHVGPGQGPARVLQGP
jgi:hypothetical protein